MVDFFGAYCSVSMLVWMDVVGGMLVVMCGSSWLVIFSILLGMW